MFYQELIDAIQLGLRRGYYHYKQIHDNYDGFEDKMTEYLLTVFVSIEISGFSFRQGRTRTRLEYPLWRFYTEAFPKIKYTNPDDLFKLNEHIIRQYKHEQTKQRIDITVFKEELDYIVSLHGIELKAINTSKDGIVKDLKRLSDSMITTDITGHNAIESCYSAFIKMYKNDGTPVTSTELKTMKNETEYWVEEILNNSYRNNKDYAGLEYHTNTVHIDTQSSEEYLESYKGIPDLEPEYSEAAENTGEVLGVVVEISRKKS